MGFLVNLIIYSLILIVLIIAIRAFELKRKKDIIPRKLRKSLDHKFLHILEKVISSFLHAKDSFIYQIKRIPYVVSKYLVNFWHAVMEKSEKFIDTAKGRGIPTKGGSASFFLTSVSRYKSSLRKK